MADHWQNIYSTRQPEQLSWYQASSDLSLDLVREAAIGAADPVVDVGAGASRFVDGLLERGHRDITLLDISDAALDVVRRRLSNARGVDYVTADVTRWEPPRQFALWHDRAVFHFLVNDADRVNYRRTLAAALAPGGRAIVATFDLHGPERCSGLPVRRYSDSTLAAELCDVVRPLDSRREVHHTPAGATQSFVYVLFERSPERG
jgi:SAM-dependent methyltransferase